MISLSKRLNSLEGSGIRRIFELAAKNKGECVNLSIGQPDFKVPASLKRAAKRAIDADVNSYTSTSGLPELKAKIASKLNKENNIKAKEDEIIVTPGVSSSIFLLLSALLNPGDEVIMPDPYFLVYEQIIKFLGAKLVTLDTYPDFHLDSAKLEKLITKKTKLIILNSPSNPTGMVYGRAELTAVAEVVKKYDLIVISDEIYEYFDFEQKFFSIGSIYKKTITLNGYSKSHAITGWRVGYAHGPKEVIEAMNKLQQYTFVCAPSFAQQALVWENEFSLAMTLKDYRRKRDLVYQSLKDSYELNRPEGAFYAFIKIPKGRNDFIEEVIKNNLLVVPGNVFSKKNTHFRLCFAAPDAVLIKGLAILNKLAKK